MSWSMRFLGFSMWVFGEAERCEVVPRHSYKPSWLYGLFVRWHEASKKRIYFFYPLSFPPSLRSFFLIFSLRLILFLSLLISALCFAILLLDEFGLFPCLSPPVFPRQEISTKARQRNERLSVFYHSANLLVVVIMTISISCIVIMLLQLVFVLYMCY